MAKSSKFGFVTYEESNPLPNVLAFLTANHYCAAVSPLHVDVWEESDVTKWRQSMAKQFGVAIPAGATEWQKPTGRKVLGSYGQMVDETEAQPVPQVGDEKKAHRHYYIELDYAKGVDQMLSELAPLNILYVEPIKSRKAYIRYLCHLDTPEKRRYSIKDVIALGGCDISVLWQKDDASKYLQDKELAQIIAEKKLTNVHALSAYLLAHDEMTKFAEVKARFGYWERYMRGAYYVGDWNIAEISGDMAEDEADGLPDDGAGDGAPGAAGAA